MLLILGHDAPKSPLEFALKLRGKTHNGRCEYRQRMNSLKLSEMALEVLPMQWLQINFPKIATGARPDKRLWSIDGIVWAFRNNFATANYALAAALAGLEDISIFQNPNDRPLGRKAFSKSAKILGRGPALIAS